MLGLFYWSSASLVLASVVLGLSASSLFYWWVAMELNLLAFIGWVLSQEESSSLKIKYFIIQSAGSAIFFLAMLLTNWSDLFLSLLIFSVIWKLGLAPLHFWFVEVIAEVKKSTMFVMFTIQKILPFLILLNFVTTQIFWWVIILSVSVALMGASFQKNWKKMLAYSSIFSGSWLMLTLGQFQLFFIFFSVYALSVKVVLTSVSFSAAGSESGEPLVSSESTLSLLMGLLSLGGVPPFLGFFGKIYVLSGTLWVHSFYFLIFITMSSAYLIYMYIRLFYTFLCSYALSNFLVLQPSSSLSESSLLLCGGILFFWFLREGIMR